MFWFENSGIPIKMQLHLKNGLFGIEKLITVLLP